MIENSIEIYWEQTLDKLGEAGMSDQVIADRRVVDVLALHVNKVLGRVFPVGAIALAKRADVSGADHQVRAAEVGRAAGGLGELAELRCRQVAEIHVGIRAQQPVHHGENRDVDGGVVQGHA